MAELSKQALKVENNTEFPNNNAGLITPSKLRAFNVDMIDSLVDEISYNADSASWNTSIDAINQFTASASGLQTGSLLVTASAAGNTITFTKGDSSTFNVTVATGSIPDISALNQATSSLQAFTASADSRLTNLESTTASLNTSVTNINSFTASAAVSITNLNASSASQQISINNLNGATGSYATTGSNTFVGANTFTSISASSFVSASEFIGNGSKLTGITASISMPILDEGVPQGNAVSLNFTGSAIGATVVGGVAIISVSGLDSGSFNAYTASVDADLAAIHQATASLQSTTASLNTSASLALYTASFNTGTRNLTFTKGDTTQFSVNIPDVSGSAGDFVTTSSFNSYTASTDSSISQLNASSASQQVSIDALNVYTASQSTASIVSSISQLNQATASLQSATSSLFSSASLALVTASFDNGTRNLTFTKGDTQTFSVTIPDTSGSAGTTIYETVYTGENITKGDPLYISGSQGANPIVYKADAAVAAKMPVTFISNETINASNTTQAIVLGLIEGINLTGYEAGQAVYVAEGGGWSTSKPSGSASITQLLGVVTKGGSGGKGLVLNPGPATLPGLDNGYMWVGNANNQPTEITTASFATTGSNQFNGNQIVNGYVSASNGFFANDNTTTLTVGEGSNIRFISGSSFYNVQLVPGVGDIAFSRDGASNIKTFTLAGAAGNNTTFQNNPVVFNDSVSSLTINAQSTAISGSGSYSVQASTITETATSVTTNASASVRGTFSVTGQSGGDGRAILLGHSGSLVLGNSGTNTYYADLAHLSSSQANTNTNLIFKTNTNTADTIISSSANIFTNPSAPTAGFKRYMTGGNIGIGGSGAAFPQISGSMAFSPTIANNYFGVSSNPLTLRGPVSSSAYLINNNVLAGGAFNLGTSATLNFERVVNGLNIVSNLLAGNINAVASKTTLSASVNITNNIIGGGANLNMDSSSIGFSGNSVQGTVNFNNSYFPATTGSQAISSVNGGLFIGTHTIYTSGSNTTFTGAPGRTVTNAVMMGTNNVISASLNGDLAQVASTALIGQGLIVVGSNSRNAGASAADWGSVFVGRWNSDLGTSDMTGETIFAVGTGTGASTRKTGFLIDSGSNTFVEGTLNVSGATSLNGNLNITGSLTASLQQGYVWVGNASGITTTVATSSFGGGGGASFPYSGSVEITGSVKVKPFTLSVASQTASIDMNESNYFILNLPTSSTTHVAFTNIIPGESINLLVSQSATAETGSIAFAPNIYFPGGNDFVATATGSAKDIVSFITFNDDEVYATNVKNLK